MANKNWIIAGNLGEEFIHSQEKDTKEGCSLNGGPSVCCVGNCCTHLLWMSESAQCVVGVARWTGGDWILEDIPDLLSKLFRLSRITSLLLRPLLVGASSTCSPQYQQMTVLRWTNEKAEVLPCCSGGKKKKRRPSRAYNFKSVGFKVRKKSMQKLYILRFKQLWRLP